MKHVLLGFAIVALVAGNVMAQDVEVTDEDIKNYAVIELAKNSIVQSISPMVNELIEKQEGMTGQRFQELQDGQGEPAQEWETQFMGVVNKQIDKRKKAATDVVKLLAGNAMGAAKYKATKSALSDPAMKAKFDQYMAAFE
jgi:hypothetical protein